jgi:hypothetical protein
MGGTEREESSCSALWPGSMRQPSTPAKDSRLLDVVNVKCPLPPSPGSNPRRTPPARRDRDIPRSAVERGSTIAYVAPQVAPKLKMRHRTDQALRRLLTTGTGELTDGLPGTHHERRCGAGESTDDCATGIHVLRRYPLSAG